MLPDSNRCAQKLYIVSGKFLEKIILSVIMFFDGKSGNSLQKSKLCEKKVEPYFTSGMKLLVVKTK